MTSPSSPFQFEQPVRSVAIIGAGPSGLAVAHALLKEPAPSSSSANLSSFSLDTAEPYFRVTLFERQDAIGGVWNYTPESKPATDGYPAAQVPATNPLLPGSSDNAGNSDDGNGWYNAMYRDLETNIPTDVMQFVNTPFPEGTDLFPSGREVRDYVRAYGSDVEPLVRLRTEVIDAHKEGSSWVVTYRHFDEKQGSAGSSSSIGIERFDALVLATGHYDTPYIPEVPGLHAFAAAHEGVVAHAKAFSVPEAYTGKRVLIVGNSASGFDIASEIAGGGARRVYRSSRGALPPVDESVQDPRVEDRPLISEYRASTGEVIFTDGTGLVLGRDLDHVLYCTGYLYAFPFLKSYVETPAAAADVKSHENNDNLVQYHPEAKTNNRLYRLYRQLIYYPDPTLAVIVMAKLTVPFPLAESQGAVLARVYSGRLQLPAVAEMRAAERERERQVASECGADDAAAVNGQAFHCFKFPRDVEYYRLLQTWLDKVSDRPEQGFHPLVWDDAKYERRQRTSQLKLDRVRKRLDKVREDLDKEKKK
jgi:hypothetical protein